MRVRRMGMSLLDFSFGYFEESSDAQTEIDASARSKKAHDEQLLFDEVVSA